MYRLKCGSTILVMILLFMFGIFIGFGCGINAERNNISKSNKQQYHGEINEFICIDGEAHDFKFLDRTEVKNDKDYYDVNIYMCKKCGYVKKIDPR